MLSAESLYKLVDTLLQTRQYRFASYIILEHKLEYNKAFLEEFSGKLVKQRIYDCTKVLLKDEEEIKLRLIEEKSQSNERKTAMHLINLFGYDINEEQFENMRQRERRSAFNYFMNRHYKKKETKSEYLSLEKLEEIFQSDPLMLEMFVVRMSEIVDQAQ